MNSDSTQKSMSWLAFTVMRTVMSMRRQFRNVEAEVTLAGIKPGEYILDFGCGLGYNTIPAAMKVGIQGRVIAQDVSPRALRVVKNKAIRCGFRNIDYVLSDRHTGLERASLDIVYLHNTLPLVRDKKEALMEICRVLKPGGRLSYMSRTGSRIFGNNAMSESGVLDYLVSDLHMILLIEQEGHHILQKKA